MPVYIKTIPTLQGAIAERFVKMSEDNLRNRGTVDFSKQAANSRAILAKKDKFGRFVDPSSNRSRRYEKK